MSRVAFKLVDGADALRHAMPGGAELALDGDKPYETDDPAEIATLDGHPSVERAKKKAAA